MTAWLVAVRRARGAVCALLLLGCCACHGSESPSDQPTPAGRNAGSSAAAAVPTARQYEALPRSVAGITLGMSATEAEDKLGKLICHANRAGYQVCAGTNQPTGEFRNLQLYLVHDRVVSVSYESPAPTSMWDALNALIDRYGRPSLSGLRERDTSGRLHEIYGWKDDNSLYSVRFMWREAESAEPELVGTAIALWDRKGYQQWEAEAKQRDQPTPEEGPPRGPI
jgi:hypothetical protein